MKMYHQKCYCAVRTLWTLQRLINVSTFPPLGPYRTSLQMEECPGTQPSGIIMLLICYNQFVIVLTDIRFLNQVGPKTIFSSGPQPFLRHGPVSCKTGLQSVADKHNKENDMTSMKINIQ